MQLDWNRIKQKAAELYADAAQKVLQYTPESFSKEKKFVNAVVAGMALIIVADKNITTDEVIAAMDMIKELPEIAELDMQKEAIELFEYHLEKLTSVMDNSVKYVLETSKLIGDIARIKQYPEYVSMLKGIIDHIAQADGNVAPEEEEMIKKIKEALN